MRYFLISIFVHLLIVSFVWVGFSVSSPRQSGTFTYFGQMIAPSQPDQENVLSEVSSKGVEAVMNDESSSAFFQPWLKMRQLNKPR